MDKSELEHLIVDTIYRGSFDAAQFRTALEMIADLFAGAGATILELDRTRPEVSFACGVRQIDGTFFDNYQAYAEIDPAPLAFAASALQKATHTDVLFSDEERRRSAFLHEFFIPFGLKATLGSPLLSSRGRFAMVAVHQSVNADDFSDDDITRLERLTPHLTRALQIRRHFLESEARNQALEAVIDRNPTAMIGLRGNDGGTLFTNAAARAFAAARDGLSLDRQGRLVASDRAAANRIAMLQTEVLRGLAGGIVRVPRPSGRRPYVILVAPLRTAEDMFQTAGRGVLFAFHDPDQRIQATDESIAQLLGLPLGAARVVQAMLEGTDLKDYAERAGISMNTVRFHLKRAFAGTDTHSQAELVRAALSALNALQPRASSGANGGAKGSSF